jgi:hypothetical protein
MACFLVPLTIGIITTALRKKFPTNWRINWLNTMIFGGSVALAVEHYAHQEIVPWFPFLTAMESPETTSIMLNEMIKIGVPMAFLIILTWITMVLVYEKILVPQTTKTSHNT